MIAISSTENSTSTYRPMGQIQREEQSANRSIPIAVRRRGNLRVRPAAI
jgi:hypothetical protein